MYTTPQYINLISTELDVLNNICCSRKWLTSYNNKCFIHTAYTDVKTTKSWNILKYVQLFRNAISAMIAGCILMTAGMAK